MKRSSFDIFASKIESLERMKNSEILLRERMKEYRLKEKECEFQGD